MTLRSLAPEASASANSATSAYKNLKLLLGSNPKPRWVLITLIHIYDEPESSQANKFTVVTLPEASASANSATSAHKNLKLLLGSNPKPRWVLITLIHIYDEPESSQANKFTVVTLPEASASANSATPAYANITIFTRRISKTEADFINSKQRSSSSAIMSLKSNTYIISQRPTFVKRFSEISPTYF